MAIEWQSNDKRMKDAKPSLKIPAVAELQTALLKPPADVHGPVFSAPWEAHAFAMTLSLHERGVFTWKEWAATLSQAIRDAQAGGDADSGATYYHHWLTALERITTEKKLVSSTLMAQRKDQWEDAAWRTPHGKPIELIAAAKAKVTK